MELLQIFMTLFLVCITKLKCGTSAEISLEIPRLSRIKNLNERIDLHKSANYLLMPHIYRAFIYGGSSEAFLANYSVSNGCQSSLKLYYKALQQRRSWAWKMYDSTGKQAAGIFLGATTWTGNYRECLSDVKNSCSPTKKSGVCQETIPPTSQFCSVHMTHAPWMPRLIAAIRLPFPVPYSPFIVDVCVPSNCSDKDISKVVGAFLAIDNFGDNLNVTNVYCHHERQIQKDVPAIICVVVLCIILAMVILGTSFDIYRRQWKVRVKEGPEITIGYDKETDKFGILKILMSPRKRKRRRGTLSSSEPFDTPDKMDKLKHRNVRTVRERSVSENLGVDPDIHRPDFNRMPSAPATYIELEDIPETNETNNQEDSVISTNSTSPPKEGQTNLDKDDTDYNSDDTKKGEGDIISDDAASETGENSETAPMTPSANSRSDSIKLARKINRQHSIIEVKPSHKSQKMSVTNNLLTDLLLSFSFRKNTRHILAEGSPDTLYSLNGVRVLSIAWIVLGNVYGIIYQSPEIVDNHVAAVKMTQTWWMQMVINTTLAADSFFVLSGTLGAYHFLKVKTKAGKDKVKNWRKVMSFREYLFTIVHRLVRILPCYAVLLMLGTNLMPYLGDGPRWSFEIENVKICKRNWWANILFISNFYDPDNMCLPHTYYLANDFQFFLLSPIVLIPLLIKPKIGLGLIGFFVTAQVVIVTVLNQGINGNVLRMRTNNYWSLIYVKPYSRIGVYCIGLGLGYFLFVCDRQMKFKKIPLYIGWFVTTFLCFLLPYVTYAENKVGGRKWTGVETALYEAFSRPAWALALSWIIFCCSTGQGGFIGKFLSWNFFLPLCRITYGVFLLHPILIAVVIESEHHNFYLSFVKLVYTYIPLFVCSYLMAFLLISCVECPFTAFESYIRLRFKSWNRDRKLRKLQDI